MLRFLFHEPARVDSGPLLAANEAISNFRRLLKAQYTYPQSAEDKYYRIEMWARGFSISINELEQSIYCSEKLMLYISKSFEDEMNREELDQYHLHLYFYKNSFIRVFAILDKLGYFMNDLFGLQTEQAKLRFSYFTVLRQLYQMGIHSKLSQTLYDLKLQYSIPLEKLRKQRNVEIHSMNSEVLNDLLETHTSFVEHMHVENLKVNAADLNKAYDMICASVIALFTYCNEELLGG